MPEKDPPIVIVTGAGRGLGSGIATELAKSGYSVVIHYGRSRDSAEDVAEECRSLAPNPNQLFSTAGADLGSPAERRGLIPRILDLCGHFDALVNNAGITEPNRRDCLDAAEEDFDSVIDINLKAPYFLTQAAARYWVANLGRCRIPSGYKALFISSISSDTVSVNRGAYCVSKAGVSMATQVWAARLAEHNIQVNDLRPGIMNSDMTAGAVSKYDPLIAEGLVPQRRWGTGQDLGRAVAALCDGSFPFTTGATIPVDGGFHIKRL